MAITKDEGRIGGKFCKRPLRVPSTPYDRPPPTVRGISRQQPANEAGRSWWFSKLVDSAAHIIVKGVSRLSSVFSKGVASTTPRENITTIEEVAEMPDKVANFSGALFSFAITDSPAAYRLISRVPEWLYWPVLTGVWESQLPQETVP